MHPLDLAECTLPFCEVHTRHMADRHDNRTALLVAGDVIEIKSMIKPPPLVLLVMEVCDLMSAYPGAARRRLLLIQTLHACISLNVNGKTRSVTMQTPMST